MTREQRIVMLAWSLLDAIRQPRTSMSDDQPRALAGFRRAPCPTCDGDRTVVDRFRRQVPCWACVSPKTGKPTGRIDIDAYTETRVSTVASPTVEPRVELVGCSWCQPSHGRELAGRWESLPRGTGMRGGDRCEHCDGTGWRTLTLAGDDGTRRGHRGELVAWTMRGDWPALLAALDHVRRTDRHAYRAFLADAAHGEIRSPAARRALDHLAQSLPQRLHVPADIRTAYDARHHRAKEAERKRQARLGSTARRARDREMRAARRNGMPADVVAAAHGVSERTVRRAG